MTEPFYVRQTAEPMTEAEANHWFHVAAQEAFEEGATHSRYTVHDLVPNLRIVEAWKRKPNDEGEPRWALVKGKS